MLRHICSFFCAMVAAMTLKFLDPFGSGKLVLFQVTYDRVCFHLGYLDPTDSLTQDWHAYELVPFLFLGVIGVGGPIYSDRNHLISCPGRLRRMVLQIKYSLDKTSS